MRHRHSDSLPNDTTKDELLTSLRVKGISDHAVLNALQTVPREKFVPEVFRRKAYNDVALPIGRDQTISQPFTVAYMTQQLQVQPGMKILEVGTGSGYQAAILSAMGANVISIERQKELFERTSLLFDAMNIRVKCILGDGSKGYSPEAPYDRIVVTAGAPFITNELKEQLIIGGRIVAPVGSESEQHMVVIERRGEHEFFEWSSREMFAFVPLIGEGGWKNKGSVS